MPRPCRNDIEGEWYHVMNRGIARRPLFENDADIRQFLAALVKQVHLGKIKVAVYCLMTTHYHLIVQSQGRLSHSLGRIQSEYTRWFNHIRRRDGTLFKGRFVSKQIVSGDYWICLIRYIDQNPVEAELVEKPWDYPFSSAGAYSGHRPVPPWLDADWMAHFFGRSDRWDRDNAEAYRAFIDPRSSDRQVWAIMRQGLGLRGSRDPWSGRDAFSAQGVMNWFERNAGLADGIEIGLPVSSPELVRDLIRSRRLARPPFTIASRGHRFDGWRVLEIGLLRDTSCVPFRVIAELFGSSTSIVYNHHRLHRRALRSVASYESRFRALLPELIRPIRSLLDLAPLRHGPSSR